MSVIERERVVTDADVLNRAAELIEERGWCQHSYHGSGGTLCAEGAIFEAISEFGLPRYSHHVSTWIDRPFAPKSLPFWNDRPERTREEVVAKLRELAEGASCAN